eukprot:scaffold82116_cov25-Tisochrysis_lutea.AAC.1
MRHLVASETEGRKDGQEGMRQRQCSEALHETLPGSSSAASPRQRSRQGTWPQVVHLVLVSKSSSPLQPNQVRRHIRTRRVGLLRSNESQDRRAVNCLNPSPEPWVQPKCSLSFSLARLSVSSDLQKAKRTKLPPRSRFCGEKNGELGIASTPASMARYRQSAQSRVILGAAGVDCRK